MSICIVKNCDSEGVIYEGGEPRCKRHTTHAHKRRKK